jgi:hypothetical protein
MAASWSYHRTPQHRHISIMRQAQREVELVVGR